MFCGRWVVSFYFISFLAFALSCKRLLAVGVLLLLLSLKHLAQNQRRGGKKIACELRGGGGTRDNLDCWFRKIKQGTCFIPTLISPFAVKRLPKQTSGVHKVVEETPKRCGLTTTTSQRGSLLSSRRTDHLQRRRRRTAEQLVKLSDVFHPGAKLSPADLPTAAAAAACEPQPWCNRRTTRKTRKLFWPARARTPEPASSWASPPLPRRARLLRLGAKQTTRAGARRLAGTSSGP